MVGIFGKKWSQLAESTAAQLEKNPKYMAEVGHQNYVFLMESDKLLNANLLTDSKGNYIIMLPCL
jgi:hypothetical protein